MREALSTYLKDHYAGSSGGTELCRRIAESSDDEAEAREVRALAAEIEADQASLEEIMSRLGVSPSRFKALGAWIGEKAGRGKLRASSGEGRVLQYEAMIMGVTGKLQLWRSLTQVEAQVPQLQAAELSELARRAEDQRASLESLHGAAALELDR
jgi:hypothetical protein